jgi:hypothetical protein
MWKSCVLAICRRRRDQRLKLVRQRPRGRQIQGSARVWRAGFGVAPKQSLEKIVIHRGFRAFRKVGDGEDAIANTRDACVTQSAASQRDSGHTLSVCLAFNRDINIRRCRNPSRGLCARREIFGE